MAYPQFPQKITLEDYISRTRSSSQTTKSHQALLPDEPPEWVIKNRPEKWCPCDYIFVTYVLSALFIFLFSWGILWALSILKMLAIWKNDGLTYLREALRDASCDTTIDFILAMEVLNYASLGQSCLYTLVSTYLVALFVYASHDKAV